MDSFQTTNLPFENLGSQFPVVTFLKQFCHRRRFDEQPLAFIAFPEIRPLHDHEAVGRFRCQPGKFGIAGREHLVLCQTGALLAQHRAFVLAFLQFYESAGQEFCVARIAARGARKAIDFLHTVEASAGPISPKYYQVDWLLQSQTPAGAAKLTSQAIAWLVRARIARSFFIVQ